MAKAVKTIKVLILAHSHYRGADYVPGEEESFPEAVAGKLIKRGRAVAHSKQAVDKFNRERAKAIKATEEKAAEVTEKPASTTQTPGETQTPGAPGNGEGDD